MNIDILVNVVLQLMAEHDDPLKTLVKHFTVMSHNTHTPQREGERSSVHHTAAVPRPLGALLPEPLSQPTGGGSIWLQSQP